MSESISITAEPQDAFELGEMLGQRRVYGIIAGRCSAADAESVRRIREGKLYLQRSRTWEDFCPKYLGMSKQCANRIIRTLEELGPEYFELAQLTRITAEQFRALAPSVHDHAMHVGGEAIALIPENAERLAAAASELAREAEPGLARKRAEAPVENRRESAWKVFDKAAKEFESLLKTERTVDRLHLIAMLQRAGTEIGRIAHAAREGKGGDDALY